MNVKQKHYQAPLAEVFRLPNGLNFLDNNSKKEESNPITPPVADDGLWIPIGGDEGDQDEMG